MTNHLYTPSDTTILAIMRSLDLSLILDEFWNFIEQLIAEDTTSIIEIQLIEKSINTMKN